MAESNSSAVLPGKLLKYVCMYEVCDCKFYKMTSGGSVCGLLYI